MPHSEIGDQFFIGKLLVHAFSSNSAFALARSGVLIVGGLAIAGLSFGEEAEQFSTLYKAPLEFLQPIVEELPEERPDSSLEPFGAASGPDDVQNALRTEWPHRLPSLGEGVIYDVRDNERIRGAGIDFQDGDLVLYSPESALLYVRSSQEKIELFESAYGGCSLRVPPERYRVTIHAHAGNPGESGDCGRILSLSFVTRSGSPAEVAFGGKPGEEAPGHLTVMLTEGPFMDLHLDVSGELSVTDRSFAFGVSSILQYGETLTILEQSDGAERISVSAHVTGVFLMDELKESIDAELEKLGFGKNINATGSVGSGADDDE